MSFKHFLRRIRIVLELFVSVVFGFVAFTFPMASPLWNIGFLILSLSVLTSALRNIDKEMGFGQGNKDRWFFSLIIIYLLFEGMVKLSIITFHIHMYKCKGRCRDGTAPCCIFSRRHHYLQFEHFFELFQKSHRKIQDYLQFVAFWYFSMWLSV